MSDNFCHLHGHSYFSMLDGLGSIEQIFQKAKDLNQEYIAVTDHGSMYGIVPAAVESKKTGIKLIHGFEAYVVKDASIKDKSERSSESEVARKHLILLAKDNEGYKRLMKICSWGMCEGFYYRPRIDDSILEKYGTEGLIASSACFVPSKYLTVITKSEVKNLLDVNAADLVKTHTGEWKFVITPTTRYYEGNLYTVYIANEFPMTVTENHKFLVLRENTQKISDDYKYLNPWYNSDEAIDCLTNHSWVERYRGSYVPEWLKVQNIQQGDFLLYPINMEKLNIEEVRQYILSQIDNFTFNEQDLNYHLISISLNYVCNIRDKLNQLLVYSWIYDRLGYYELVLDKCKLEQIKENKLCPTNMMEMPLEFEGKLYLRRRVHKIEQSVDKIQVHCLNVNQDHSFVINNAISANCIAGSISQYILHDDYEAAKKEALRYQQLFHGDFYLELMPHKHLQEQANRGLLKIHEETNIPLILTSDFHYINQEDKEAHEVLLCAQQKTTLSDPNRWKFEEGFYYIMSRDEIIKIFQEHHPYIPSEKLKEAADNTVKIAEQCNVEIKMGHHYLPKIDPYVELKANPQLEHEFNMFESRRLQEIALHNNITIDEAKNRVDASNEYLRFLTIHGWHGMYQQDQLNAKHISLLMHELDIIQSLGFASYFLLLEEILAFCAKENISVGVARGCGNDLNKVNTLNKGLVNINQIKKDDQVLGLDDKYHQVLQTYEYDCDEDLIQIKTENNKIIEGLTKDHKVLGLKKEDYVEGKEYTISDFKWYKIDELDVNDYIVEI